MMETLRASRIEGTGIGTDTAGNPLPARTVSFTPRAAHPSGEQCGTFITASVVLDAAGLHQAP
jgi:hypothetical protein